MSPDLSIPNSVERALHLSDSAALRSDPVFGLFDGSLCLIDFSRTQKEHTQLRFGQRREPGNALTLLAYAEII